MPICKMVGKTSLTRTSNLEFFFTHDDEGRRGVGVLEELLEALEEVGDGVVDLWETMGCVHLALRTNAAKKLFSYLSEQSVDVTIRVVRVGLQKRMLIKYISKV